ncbi:MAG: hypothetical protein LBS43_05415 [Prevotellaceae bacterium]|nr:hypothetical protein [Prevotellaceae bacterium]
MNIVEQIITYCKSFCNRRQTVCRMQIIYRNRRGTFCSMQQVSRQA